MTPIELIICKNIYNALVTSQYPSSPEYKRWEYLAPKETTQNPTYRSVVKRPMDFEIISNKFKSRAYAKKEDFYSDIQLMYNNARTYFIFSPLAIESINSLEALFTQLKKEYENSSIINGNGTSNDTNNNGVNGSASKTQPKLSSLSAVKPTSQPTLNGGSNLKSPPEQQKGRKGNQSGFIKPGFLLASSNGKSNISTSGSSSAAAVPQQQHQNQPNQLQNTPQALNGGWQSDKDVEERRKMMAKILLILRQIAPQEWLNKLPQMGKLLEVSLYRSAPSFDAYNDISTLKARLQQWATSLSAGKPTSQPTLNGVGSTQGSNLKSPPEGRKGNQSGFKSGFLLASSNGKSNISTSGSSSAAAVPQQQHQNANLKPSTEYDHSISYIKNVKNRFAAQPEICSKFMKLLDKYNRGASFNLLVEEVGSLFGDHLDLIREFKIKFEEASKLVQISKRSVGLVEAQTYVGTIKAKGPQVYGKFTTILDAYKSDMYQLRGLPKLVNGIASLFKDDADLIKGFARFLPTQEHVKDQFKTLVDEANAKLVDATKKANQVTPVANGQSQSHQPNQLQNLPPAQQAAFKRRHKQQRLLLLHHSSKCNNHDPCPVSPYCAEMKVLWKHIANCIDSDCKVPHCLSSRSVLSHYHRCKEVSCQLCGPVRRVISRSNGISNGNGIAAMQQPTTASQPNGHPKSPPESKKRKANGSANEAPPSKKNSVEDDAKFAAELQKLEEQWAREDQGMLSTTTGRAYKFAERVTSEVFSLERNQGNVGITSVAKDDMVQMAESMLMLIDTFKSLGKDTNVDLGFHFTSEDSMGHIQRDGLMTMSDRESNPKLNSQEAQRRHGGVFGDGVYSGNNPATIKKYGPVGILIARLQGNTNRIKPDEVELSGTLASVNIRNVKAPLGQKAIEVGIDTVIGNNDWGLAGSPQNTHLDEVVLLRSAQCIPLVRFPSSLVPDNGTTIPHPIQPWFDAMSNVVNEFFNGKSPATLKSPPASSPKTALAATSARTGRPPPHRSSSTLPVTQEVVKYVAPDTISDTSSVSDLGMLLETPNEALSSTEVCVICLDPLVESSSGVLRVKKCKHMFCKNCLLGALNHSRKCPTCQGTIGEPQGKCPDGEMHISVNQALSCGGHDNVGTFIIVYKILAGIQKVYHEIKGNTYPEIQRAAYLPDNDDGRRFARRLKYAFSRGLTFRIGTSQTIGKEGQVTWCIRHRTSHKSGPYGWPDASYFVRCNKELYNLGVPKACDCK